MDTGESKTLGEQIGESQDSLEFPVETLARSAITPHTPRFLKFDLRYHSSIIIAYFKALRYH